MSKMRRILSAAEGTIDYPIDPRSILYLHVKICDYGTFHPWGVPPEGITFDQGYFAELAANYDPFFYAATVNCDHPELWFWGPLGPASGLVLSLSAEADGLYADLAIFDYWLADQIDRGMWPARSIEWFDSTYASGQKFYDKFEKYLTGLALLGLESPAVPGLGPMPQREPDVRDEMPAEPEYYAYPLAASSARGNILTLTTPSSQSAATQTNPQEAPPMAGLTPGAPAPITAPPTGGDLQAAQELAAARQDNERLQKENVELKEKGRLEAAQKKLDGLKAGGKATAAQLDLLGVMSKDPAQAAAFAATCEVLAAGVAQVPLGETAPPGDEPPEINDGKAGKAGVTGEAKSERIKAYAKQNSVSFEEAFIALEGKEKGRG